MNDGEIKELIAQIKQQLKLSNCRIKKIQDNAQSYEIITPEGDFFWFYFYVQDLPAWNFERIPVGRPSCKQTFIYEKTIMAHIKHCFSLYYSSLIDAQKNPPAEVN
jgi:hypothetical protein